VSPLDVLSAGTWGALKELEDDDLKRLVGALPMSVLLCRASSTTKKYLGVHKSWKVWAADHKLAAFPVEGVHLTLYLQHLAEVKGSKAAVEEAVNSLSWAHNLTGITPPSASPIVQIALEGLRRALARPVCKKAPFTIEMLGTIVQDAKKRDTLTSICLATACLLSFAGFLRFVEVANIRLCNLQIGVNYLLIKILKAKQINSEMGMRL